jgi:hypothetical protein
MTLATLTSKLVATARGIASLAFRTWRVEEDFVIFRSGWFCLSRSFYEHYRLGTVLRPRVFGPGGRSHRQIGRGHG